MELSYFKLRLIAFFKESHPNKVNKHQFIKERSELATDTYARSIASAYNHLEALGQANAELYRGLHFSKYDTLFEKYHCRGKYIKIRFRTFAIM